LSLCRPVLTKEGKKKKRRKKKRHEIKGGKKKNVSTQDWFAYLPSHIVDTLAGTTKRKGRKRRGLVTAELIKKGKGNNKSLVKGEFCPLFSFRPCRLTGRGKRK